MIRQSISLTAKNEEWLKNQVSTKEFGSKSEIINHLIKQARSENEYYAFVKAKIDKAEKNGFPKKQTKQKMLAEFKKGLPDV